MPALTIARCVFLGLVTVLALLAVFRVPVGALWMPAVASTEAGYVLVLLTIPAFAGGVSTPVDRVLFGVGVVCVALFLSPLVRARSVARATPAGLARAFASLPGSAPPPPPFEAGLAYSRLLAISSPDVSIETLTYATPAADTPLRLDLFRGSRSGSPRPLVVIVHGGSWSGGDRTQLPAIAHRLAHDGWVVASIDYRLAPAHPFPAALDDVRSAVDFLRANAARFGIDADRVVLYGRSAGAHLALLAAYRWKAPFVRGVVALYPPTDLIWSSEHPANPLVLDTPATLGAFLGGMPTDSPEMRARYRDASPIDWVDADSPPTLLVHGGRDELVFPRQTERLAERLEAAHVPNYALLLPWATHGCEASLAGPSGQLVESSVRYFLAIVAPADR